MEKSYKKRYSLNALLLVFSTLVVKTISVLYKIPLTSLIGATGRGYFGVAYNLFVPIFALCVGGFPVAVSKIVSSELVKNNFSKIKEVKKSSFKLFFISGLVGTILLVILAKPYAIYVAKEPNAVYSIYAIAPSIFFSCLTASKRGFFEGFSNMIPTSVTQIMEAMFKMIFGLLFSKLVMGNLFQTYLQTGMVFGKFIATDKEALSLIYPMTSAGAILGITFGCFISWIYIEIYSLLKSYSLPYGSKYKGQSVTKEVVKVAMPIIIASLVQSVSNFLDTATIQNCLGNMDVNALEKCYEKSISISETQKSDISTYVYGIYNTVMDFKNIAPMLTGAVGVASIPALSGAFSVMDKVKIKLIYESLIKYSVVIGGGVGFLMAAIPEKLIYFIYGSDNLDIVLASKKLMVGFGLFAIIFAVSGPIVYAVQAIGFAKTSVYSFLVSGAVKTVLNLYFISNPDINLVGSVYSNIVAFLIIDVWNLAIFLRKTSIKFDIFRAFLKPLLISFSILFVADYLELRLNYANKNRIGTLFETLIIVIYYSVCLITFGVLDIKKNKLLNSQKNETKY